MKLALILCTATLFLNGFMSPPENAMRSSWGTQGSRYDADSLQSDLESSLSDLEDAMHEESERD